MAGVVASGESHGMLLGPGGLDVGTDPVLVDDAVRVERVVVVVVGKQFAHPGVAVLVAEVGEQGLAAHLRPPGEALHGRLAFVSHDGTAVDAGLGGHEDDAVTGLCAVNGRGSCILQDVDRHDHGRVEVLDAGDLEAVDDIERGDVATVRRISANADVSARTRSTVGDDVHAGSLALEGAGGICGGQVAEVFELQADHGTGEVGFALETVTDNDGRFEEFEIVLEDDIVNGTVADGERVGLVADAFDADAGSCGDDERIGTVQAGDGTDTDIADHGDVSVDDRRSLGINDMAADGFVLCERAHPVHQGEEYPKDTCYSQQIFYHFWR